MKRIGNRKFIIYLIILLIYILLPTLILVGIIDFSFRFYMLTFISIVLFIVGRLMGYSASDLGIKKGEWRKSLRDVMPITLGLVVICLVYYFAGYSRLDNTVSFGFLLFYIFISSPVQEFIYRGFSTKLFQELTSKKWIVIVLSSVLYSYVHVIYTDIFTVLATFVIGIIWHYIYMKTTNIIGVSLSHAVLGILTIIIGAI